MSTAAAVRNAMAVFAVGLGALSPTLCSAGPIVFSIGGSDSTASIQATVDAFRAALGNPNNGNTAGPLTDGRREINWDGGGPPVVDGTAPVTPFNVFRNTRGAVFTTPGVGLTQAAPTGGLLSLDLINPSYATTFGRFSLNRLFVPIGSTITDGLFFIPGTNGTVAATVGGFGAVFTDVDLANSSRIDFFDINGLLLHSAPVPTGTVADASLSFVGVVFDAGERIARVRITSGNAALGPTDNPGQGVDVVALDDFLYQEPRVVPLPSTLGLLGIGLLGLALRRLGTF